jgi:signal transduction histidine kinase
VFGAVAEWFGRPPLPVLDAATGFALIVLGLLAWQAQPRLASGAIMVAAGFCWFLGTAAPWAVFVHRAPLAQLIFTYPAQRPWPRAPLERLATVSAYAYALVYPVATNDVVTIVFAVGLVALAARRYAGGRGPQRRARAGALVAGAGFATVMALGAVLGLAGVVPGAALLSAYDGVVLLIAVGLLADLRYGEWSQAGVTALVVDLGQPTRAGSLRDRLAHTLGDPTLAIGYWVSESNRYVDESGRPIDLPVGADRRSARLIDDAGAPLAVLVHDPGALDDPKLLAEIAAATRLAVANARLQAEVRARLEQVNDSRRRLVETADEQRRQLERELREGAEERLMQVAELLAGGGPQLAEMEAGLVSVRSELRELARGIHPATLTDSGLAAALEEVSARSPLPVALTVPARRWPAAVEAAAYFVCSEAMANTVKHACASAIVIHVSDTEAELEVEVADNGAGGADLSAGSGLRGLQDRAETLGGQLTIMSPPGHGTRVILKLPLRPGQ